MAAEKILSGWKKKQYKPVYWLEGEEDYYIDQLVNYAEHNILSESEAGFNLTVFYGKDGQQAGHFFGAGDHDKYEAAIKALLSK